MRACVLAFAYVAAGAVALPAQSPKTHRLEATPATVAYGHYWSETRPVLTMKYVPPIMSGPHTRTTAISPRPMYLSG